ncbi:MULTISPECIES: S1 RNA-binding domain-containing protein [Streptomyces]|uniref:S1 RNA-binding domain-containing protein n=2 Tax=Streptomyces TaxID=1883 RepID=UPI0029C02503|nr:MULTISPECIES: S1 RNA-binding domain-containing protein [Streptomyces]
MDRRDLGVSRVCSRGVRTWPMLRAGAWRSSAWSFGVITLRLAFCGRRWACVIPACAAEVSGALGRAGRISGPLGGGSLRAFLLGLRRGATHQGQVQSVHNFGVFVNLDGEPDPCTGFIRIPELSWRWIDHPTDAVTAGQRVVGEIIGIHTRRGQVQLSLKALQEDPLLPFADQAGLVADGIAGLVHNTEFRDEPVEHPSQIVSEGDEITVRIVEVDLVRRRLTLSARNLPQSGKRPI